jgi:(S)-sulfolactate dehydrogenase
MLLPQEATSVTARPRVLVAEFIDPDGLRCLEGETAVVYRPDCGEDRRLLLTTLQAEAAGQGLHALLVRNRVAVNAEALAAAGPGLRVVGRLGVGLDNIDLAACRAAGVRVVYARGANADAVCEYVFAALLHLARRLGEADRAVRAGRWPRADFIGEQLAGRTLGVIGLGEVGRRLARRADAFGMAVLGYDPYVPDGADAGGVPRVPLEQLFAAADIVSLHAPLTPETHHLVDAAALARMRPGAMLVNAARGGIVDEAALAAALRRGHLGGAVLDVREVEPPPQPDPLAGVPSLLLTPHIAGWTHTALRSVGRMVALDVLAVLRGDKPAAEA